MSTQYRAIWPTGEEVWQGYVADDRVEFFREFDDFCTQLDKLGVPQRGWPSVQCRTIEMKTSNWEEYGEYERKQKTPKHSDTLPLDRPLVTSGPQYENQGPVEPVPVTVPSIDWQIVQVANHRFRFSDPCIICAGDFAKCGHTPTDTQALISRIKREYHV